MTTSLVTLADVLAEPTSVRRQRAAAFGGRRGVTAPNARVELRLSWWTAVADRTYGTYGSGDSAGAATLGGSCVPVAHGVDGIAAKDCKHG